MTDRELMQMALDALRKCTAIPTWPSFIPVIKDLEARLSQCERCGEVNPAEIHTCSPQEPVAWEFAGALFHDRDEVFSWYKRGDVSNIPPLPLYTAPPQRECVSCAGLCCQDYEKCNLPCTPRGREQARREWQTLTENEIKHLWYEACQTNLELTSQLIVHLARNIEAKLKEKNG